MQLTRRGFKTAAEAAQARRELLVQVKSGRLKPAAAGTTVNELLDLYLDGLDADGRLSAKTAASTTATTPTSTSGPTWVSGACGT